MTAEADITLERIAAELYALPPQEFTRARDARVRQIDDAALAKEVKALRKPLLAAWVVNLLAHEQAASLRTALELAQELREAQDDLDARALTALNRQRRGLVRALAQQAGERAGERGEKITRATTDAVEQTLNAAMFRADAAMAVASGRLVRPLDAAGNDPDEIRDAVAGALDETPAPRVNRTADEVAARRVRKAAEGELRAARSALAHAERECADLDRKWKNASEHADRLIERASELEAELARVRNDAELRAGERDALDDQRAGARSRIDDAQRTAEAAQAALDRL